jgi:N6-adenosine-specific RNA methylase IME4
MRIARAYNKIKQKERQEELRHKGFPLNKYEVIYIDSKANDWELLKRHPVNEIAKHNAILFLWAISHEVEQGLKMMEHWNFKFDNCVVWNFAEPNEWRGVEVTHDILLIGTRGAFYDFCPQEKGVLLPGIHRKLRQEEQGKRPQEYKELIHKLYPKQVKIDLIEDDKTDGWENYKQEENAKRLFE